MSNDALPRSSDTAVRRAQINAEPERVRPYLPGNYSVIGTVPNRTETATIIEGEDKAGWTLDEYVLPRLASGLIFGKELI